MKIVFICGSLEPGRDGVGDYTRRLAVELIQRRHCVSILSLNDKFVTETYTGAQQSDGVDIDVMRIPTLFSKRNKFKTAEDWMSKKEPDWISLQYVPFAFHKKGLDFKLARNLYHLGKGYKWEVMFHELWVGMEKNAGIKMKIWGKIQQMLIVKLLKAINSGIIHTHLSLYKNHLKRLGFNADILPLYSNIAVNNIENIPKDPSQSIFLIFGSIYPASDIEDIATEVVEYSKQHNMNPKLVMIGRCGKGQNVWKNIWLKKGINVEIMGEQSAEMISQTINNASVGIATTPSYLIGKSGTVAAMLEHRLPVLNIAQKWYPDIPMELELPQGVINYKKGNLKEIFSTQVPGNSNLKLVSKKFIESLS